MIRCPQYFQNRFVEKQVAWASRPCISAAKKHGRDAHATVFKAPHARRAFTLIEIMMAVLLMALLASAAAMSFSEPLRAARAKDAIELVRFFDESSRQAARRFGRPIRLSFDLSANKIARMAGEQKLYEATLPHGCRIRQIRTAARRAADGEIDIPCSPRGVTRTYGVHLTGSGVDAWMLISGFSGEVSLIKDEAQLDAIFAATATRREAQDAPEIPTGDDPG